MKMIKDYVEWIEAEEYCGYAIAEVKLLNPISINGKLMTEIVCSIGKAKTKQVKYQISNGVSSIKSEVKSWPFILWNELLRSQDLELSEEVRAKLNHELEHENLMSMKFLDPINKQVIYHKNNCI